MSLTLKLYLLLLLVLSHYVDSGSIVKFLPGFEGPLPFELETGYIGIGEEEEVQLFYYFIKSEKNPKEDPLLIWLNGGPGCSSLEGLFFENGPVGLKFEVYNGSLVSLVSSTYSWTQVANIIYLDQPVGAGFSYSRTPLDKTSDTNEAKMIHEFLQKVANIIYLDQPVGAGFSYSRTPLDKTSDTNEAKMIHEFLQKVANIIYLDQPVGAGFSYSRTPLDKTSDTNEAKMIHEFLQKWLSKHPQFLSNPFYVTGDSYSGKTIPALVQEISKGNYICCKPLINLQ
ncbi:hypothetical protein F2Q70_00041402, partial [Brassica cretica]